MDAVLLRPLHLVMRPGGWRSVIVLVLMASAGGFRLYTKRLTAPGSVGIASVAREDEAPTS